ncbi:MAG TPA: DinB family protein [Acidimicrobiales bacterium]
MERNDPEPVTNELAMLGQYLDYHRATLVGKVEGLDRDGWRATVGASELTLAGLVKHLALVEDHWFTGILMGRDDPEPWASAPWDDDRDWEFHTAPDDDPGYLVGLYAESCERSRVAVAEVGDPEGLAVRTFSDGRAVSLRWIMLHMLEETARHNGHADLLRESIDGATGE